MDMLDVDELQPASDRDDQQDEGIANDSKDNSSEEDNGPNRGSEMSDEELVEDNASAPRRSLRTSRNDQNEKEVDTNHKSKEKRGVKRKSVPNSDSGPRSKFPRYESVAVNLQARFLRIPESERNTFSRLSREQQIKLNLPKEGSFYIGDLIWTKISGYPWWPALITVDPCTGTYSKISGCSSKADRIYHIQYFGPDPSRGYSTIGNIMPFEGGDQYVTMVKEQVEGVPLKKAAKVLKKYSVTQNHLKKWNESVSEAEEALKLSPEERLQTLTFHYIVDDKSAKTPAKNAKRVSIKIPNMNNLSANKKGTPEDVYDFDEDSDCFDNGPMPGLMFRTRPQGDFQVFVRKHYDEESKANPSLSKDKITTILKEKWELLGEDMRSIYVERKAIYEDESNMLVSKRSNFDDDYFNDDSDLDYNSFSEDDSGTNSKDESHGTTSVAGKSKSRSKSRKSEQLFDKIKNQSESIEESQPKRQSTSKKASKQSKGNEKEKESAKKPTVKNKRSSQGTKKKSETLIAKMEEIPMQLNGPCVSEEDSLLSTTDIKKEDDLICYKCAELDAGELVACSGECRRMFHHDCFEMIQKDDGTYLCEECDTGRHKCFACDNSDMETKKCSDPKCGRFYHLACIENFPVTVNESANSFLCPHHKCINCHLLTLNDKFYRNNNRRKLFKCIFCPVAFHVQDVCLGAGSHRVTSNYVICPDHYQRFLRKEQRSSDRHINVNFCFSCIKGGNLICCESCPAAFHEECIEYKFDHDKNYYCSDCTLHKQLHYGDIVWVKLGQYRWWPAQIKSENDVPQNVRNLSHRIGDFPVQFYGSHDYYWVNKGRTFSYLEDDKLHSFKNCTGKLKEQFTKAMKEVAEAFIQWKDESARQQISTVPNKPPPYQNISSNKYFGTKAPLSKECVNNVCNCKEKENACSDVSCLNRVSCIECDPILCPAKSFCKNQSFRKCEYIKCEAFKTNSAGWGLKTLEDIKKGQFIIEYCGEVIDEKECEKRLRKIATTQSNFYFLTIDKDNIIDAGPKGNLSRFMNHSCEPNCETQKWVVSNVTRVGLFASKDIPAGTELTFNYNLDCKGHEQVKCECGSKKCSGYIGQRTRNEDRVVNGTKFKNGNGNKSSKKCSPPSSSVKHEDKCFKCGNDGELVMCKHNACPKSYHIACLGLSSAPDNDWLCPRHSCMKQSCTEPATTFCSVCPNSLCQLHASTANRLPDDSYLCEDHNPPNDDGLITESELNDTI